MIVKVIIVFIVIISLYVGYNIFEVFQEIHIKRKINKVIIKEFKEAPNEKLKYL